MPSSFKEKQHLAARIAALQARGRRGGGRLGGLRGGWGRRGQGGGRLLAGERINQRPGFAAHNAVCLQAVFALQGQHRVQRAGAEITVFF